MHWERGSKTDSFDGRRVAAGRGDGPGLRRLNVLLIADSADPDPLFLSCGPLLILLLLVLLLVLVGGEAAPTIVDNRLILEMLEKVCVGPLRLWLCGICAPF